MYLSKPIEDTLFIGTTFLEAFLIRLDADGGQEVGDVVGRRVFVAAEGKKKVGSHVTHSGKN